jgi:hypothetical protein
MYIDISLLNLKYKPHFINDVLNYIEQNPNILETYPLIAIHYYELMVNINSDESNYFKLKALKDKYIDKLDFTGKYNIFVNLNAFCIRMIKEGKKNYRNELLETDLEIMERDIYGSSDYISYIYLHGVVRNAARLRDFKQAEKFISAYGDRLDPKHKHFAINYAKSEIYLEQKNYSKALDCLSRISIEYNREKQQVRNMIIKIYYETGSIENALSIIDSSRHFLLKEKQIPDGRKISASNFLRFSSQLINLKMKPNELKLNQLKCEIEKTGFFANKDWLFEKIDELSKAE